MSNGNQGVLPQRGIAPATGFAECVDDIFDFVRANESFKGSDSKFFETLVEYLMDKGYNVDRAKVKECFSEMLEEMRKTKGRLRENI